MYNIIGIEGNTPTVRLGDVSLKIGSGATPKGGSKVYLESGEYILVRSQNVYNGEFCKSGLVYISTEHANQLSNAEIERDDILLNITGDSVARCCQVPEDILPGRVNQHVLIIRPKKEQLRPNYLRYFLISPKMQTYMLTLASAGATRNALTKEMVQNFIVPCPEPKKQDAIIKILGTLDDKIELNRQINETLEAMARALFKSWFVDFDPVRAKAEGRDTRLPPHIADLFPDSFEESELGLIPKGWRNGSLGEIGENFHRSINPKDVTSNMPYIGLEHMPKKSIALSNWGNAENVQSNKSYFFASEILFGKLRPYFHKVGVSVIEGVCSTDILVINSKSNDFFGFLLCHLSSDELIAYTDAASSGTKMPRTSWKDITRYKVVIPPLAVASVFDAKIRAYVKLIQSNIIQSNNIKSIRDTLLPKLISGEIRVPEAEKFGTGSSKINEER